METEVRFSIDPINQIDHGRPSGRAPAVRLSVWRNRIAVYLWAFKLSVFVRGLPFGAPWYTGRTVTLPERGHVVPGRYPYGPASWSWVSR